MWMYKSYDEIFSQGDSLKKTYKYILDNKNKFQELFNQCHPEEIIFLACGSSYLLTKSVLYNFEEETGVDTYAFSAGEIIMNKEYYRNRFNRPLIITPSRSGRTAEILYALKFFKNN